MRFLCDANVQMAVVRALRAQDHDVVRVSEMDPRMTDSRVLELARRQNRILITNDKDFGELVFLRRQLATGVMLIRLSSRDADKVAGIVTSVARNMGDRLAGQFAVLTDDRVRLRAIR